MSIKRFVRNTVRYILKVKDKETISDSLVRHKLNFYRIINRKQYDILVLKNVLIEMGIKKGDTICVHSSWRSFIGFNINPRDFIDLLINIIGDNGNILMPAYGHNEEIFDLETTPSHAGVISEIFRNIDGVYRSNNVHFSICARGYKAKELIKDHHLSKYSFDEKSPYYKLINNKGKILMVGLGKTPHKHSIFHCATYHVKDNIDYYKNIFTNKRTVSYVENNKIKRKEIIDRIPNCKNNKKAMKKTFNKIPDNSVCKKRIGFLDLVLYDAKDAFDTVVELSKQGYYIYKV